MSELPDDDSDIIDEPALAYELAISLMDLKQIAPELRTKLALISLLDMRKEAIVQVPDGDELDAGVVFTCDLLHGALTCDIIRKHDRDAKTKPCRVYVRRLEKTWKRVPSKTLLTSVKDGRPLLSPVVFTNKIPPSPVLPSRTLALPVKKLGTKRSL